MSCAHEQCGCAEMSEDELQERFKEMERQIDERVKEHGVTFQGVFASEDGPPFTYTIGMVSHGLPELVVYGPGVENGYALANLVVVELAGKMPRRGQKLVEVAQNPVVLGSVSTENLYEFLGGAVSYARRHGHPVPTAMQVVLFDREGRLPLDKGYDRAYMDSRYPCLAEGGEWDYLVH